MWPKQLLFSQCTVKYFRQSMHQIHLERFIIVFDCEVEYEIDLFVKIEYSFTVDMFKRFTS